MLKHLILLLRILGEQPPDREQWEIQNKARKEAELEIETAQIAQELEAEGEKFKSSGGKMEELHNILSITQMRINKFKVRSKLLNCSKYDTRIMISRMFVEVFQTC